MKSLFTFFLLTTSAFSQTANNNATVNIQGLNQSVSINQSGASHSATLNLSGNNISAVISQYGNTPQNFSLSVNCGSNCPNSPYIVSQY